MRWLEALEAGAPDVVAAYRGIDEGRFLSVRREVRRRAGHGSAVRVATELATLANALTTIVDRLPDAAFLAAGGDEDWNVAQAIGHDADARAGLSMAGALAARGRFPASAGPVVPASCVSVTPGNSAVTASRNAFETSEPASSA